jgi:hypothetical protein
MSSKRTAIVLFRSARGQTKINNIFKNYILKTYQKTHLIYVFLWFEEKKVNNYQFIWEKTF